MKAFYASQGPVCAWQGNERWENRWLGLVQWTAYFFDLLFSSDYLDIWIFLLFPHSGLPFSSCHWTVVALVCLGQQLEVGQCTCITGFEAACLRCSISTWNANKTFSMFATRLRCSKLSGFTGFLFILSRVFNRLLPENNWEWILLLSWAGLLRRTVYCPCHRIESSGYAMCDMRQWLWMPVASHQLLSSLDILLSSAVSSIHPSSSGCNHPSENSTCVESRGYTAVQRQTREEITYHSQLCDCWILPVCFLKGSLQTLSLFRSIFPSEHKTKMRSPLSCDNFPGVQPIECYWAVSNLSGKVLERYSRMLDVHV